MALYAQHGHAKSDKITTALADGSVQGVVFGARNEKPDKLASCISDMHEDAPNIEILIDPQFYISTLKPPNDRFLPEYPYYSAGLTATDFVGSRKLAKYAKDTLKLQVDMGASRLISPSVFFDSFDDRWYQIALNLADASLYQAEALPNSPPLLLTFAFSEAALSKRRELDDFLDQLTSWDMHGIYLLIIRDESTYSQRFEPQRLANLMYMVYALSTVNGLDVLPGYSDFTGLLLRAVGARAFATGWTQSLRQFSRRSFIRQKPGGQPPRLRYSSSPLLNSILLSELDQMYDTGDLGLALSGVALDDIITSAARPDSADWSLKSSELHHWQTLQGLDQKLEGTPADDIIFIESLIESAHSLYEILRADGVLFDRNTMGHHLEDWTEAIQLFRKLVSL